MFVLVATATPEGIEPLVAPRPIDGELVVPSMLPCRCAETCDCHRSWVGLVSGGRTATALVVRRPGIDRAQLRGAVAALVERDLGAASTAAEIDRHVDDRLGAMSAVLTGFSLGTIVVRDGDTVRPLDLDEAA